MSSFEYICFWTTLILSVLIPPASTYEFCIPACNLKEKNITEGSKVADPTDCYRYYVCSDPMGNNTDFVHSLDSVRCEEGSSFVKDPWPADDEDEPIEPRCEEYPSGGPSKCDVCDPCLMECNDETKGQLVPDPYDCKGFYHCDQNNPETITPTHFTCEDGQIFDYLSQTCAPEGNGTQCFDFCDPCKIYCITPGRYPNPYDCRGYLYCESASAVGTFHCDEGQIFNILTSACEDDQGLTCQPVCKSESEEEPETEPEAEPEAEPEEEPESEPEAET